MQAETKQQEVPAPITFAVRNKCVQRVRVVLVSNLSRLCQRRLKTDPGASAEY